MTKRLDPRVKAMTEEQLQNAIVEFAERSGWVVTFTPDWMKRLAFASMRKSPRANRKWPKAGTPDLIMAGNGRLVIAELKSHTGKLGPGQDEWLEALRQVDGVEVFLWKPTDWIDGTIEQTLGRAA